MPSNIPITDPQEVKWASNTLEMLNYLCLTPVERDLYELTKAIPDQIEVMPGIWQPAGVMATAPAVSNRLKQQVLTLGEHSEKPLNILDIGTFTGISALAMAMALKETPCGGTVTTYDIRDKYHAIAKEYFTKAKVSEFIKPEIADAKIKLQELLDQGKRESFDLIFIDADKTGYPEYYDKALQLVRPGGYIIFDNTLWSNRVAKKRYYNPESPDYDPGAKAIHDTTIKAFANPMLLSSIGEVELDGVLITRKRPSPRQFVNAALERRGISPLR